MGGGDGVGWGRMSESPPVISACSDTAVTLWVSRCEGKVSGRVQKSVFDLEGGHFCVCVCVCVCHFIQHESLETNAV